MSLAWYQKRFFSGADCVVCGVGNEEAEEGKDDEEEEE